MDGIYVLIVLGVIFGVIFLGVIYAKISMFIRGRLNIYLKNNHVIYGDILSGRVSFFSKKDIEVYKLTVSLIGEQMYYQKVDGDSRRDWKQVYEDTEILLQDTRFLMGTENTFNFQIISPKEEDSNNLVSGGHLDLSQYIPVKMKPYIKYIANNKTRWRLKVELDCPGVNFIESEVVYLKEK